MKQSGIFPSIVTAIKKNDRFNQNPLIITLAIYCYRMRNTAIKLSRAYNPPPISVIGTDSFIHPGAYIADRGVIIGNRCIIEDFAIILEDSVIEDNVIIEGGSVIGSDGFQFPRLNNELISVTHSGGVHIHNGVHIGPQCCIDKATFKGCTEIGDHSSLGGNTHIAHDVLIGKDSHIHSAMISGRTVIGDNVIIGNRASISNGLTIGNHAWIAPEAIITKNVSDDHRIESRKTTIKHINIYCTRGDYHEKNETILLQNTISEISDSAVIHPTAHIADIGVRIGDACVIGPHASVLEGTILGKGVIIGPGSVIGNGCCRLNPHNNTIAPSFPSGGVIIHDHVEVMANAHINRSVTGKYTEIGEHSKIDNLVHIGADVIIGKRNLIIASSVIGEGSKIGDDARVGPNTLISNNITIGDEAYITLGSIITKNVKEGKVMIGDCAIGRKQFFSFVKADH